MVRQSMYERYQDDAYSKGFRVYTTLSKAHQDAAFDAVRRGVLDYDRRHGYRGAEAFVDLPQGVSEDALEDALQDQLESRDIYPALVLAVTPKTVKVFRKGGEVIEIGGEGLKFARAMIGDKAPANRRLKRGALIRVQKDDQGAWEIVQLPQVEAGLVSLDPLDGAIRALVGGFDFNRNKFNHVTQAYRQPGSSFKPFVYSAALEKGFTPATVINDAPILIDASETGSVPWEPKNFDGGFDGPIRMRTALTKSKNLVSIRILQAIGPQYAQDYISRFGFDPKLHPAYLTMALGAGSVTALDLAAGYAVFANGGYRVTPYFISRVEDANGKVLAKASPVLAGEGAQRAIDVRNAFVMFNMMQDVIRGGTGARAMQLGREDLAGKTGTTNDQLDAWFAGFQRHLCAVAWVGFDLPRSLGPNETGAVAALPIWMGYVGKVLDQRAAGSAGRPRGRGRRAHQSGDRAARSRGRHGLLEFFFHENLPPEGEPVTDTASPAGSNRPDEVKSELY